MRSRSLHVRVALLLVALAAVVAVAVAVAQPAPDLPPGVAQESWVPLSERSGLRIVSRPAGKPVVAQLWAKVGGTWQPVLLQAPMNSFIPAR